MISDSNNIYYSGDIDGIFISSDNGNSWLSKNDGINKADGYNYHIQTLAINGNNLFAGTWLNGIFLSTNKGDNWMRKSNGLPLDTTLTNTNQFVYSIVIDGGNIWAGTDWGVFLSTNNGDSWTQKNKGFLDTTITSIAVTGNNIFAGTRSGAIYLSTDNGDNWSVKNIALGSPVDPIIINGNDIIVGTTDDGLYISADNGDSWTHKFDWEISDMTSLVIYKNNILFAATEQGGVAISIDYGDTWNEINDGITDWDEGRLTIKDNYIYYGSYSGLIFKAKLDDLITDVKENEQNNKTIITPNPASDFLNIHSSDLIGKEITIYDMLGNKIKTVIAESMDSCINIESLSMGIYLIRIGEFTKIFIKE
jgi:photosystem II stability/assembly factor-like uncharacterized protein